MELETFGDGLVTETTDGFNSPDRGDLVQLACNICGGREFHVGVGEYYTAIRCVKCLIPCPVHQG